jgi:hypothetical protein
MWSRSTWPPPGDCPHIDAVVDQEPDMVAYQLNGPKAPFSGPARLSGAA